MRAPRPRIPLCRCATTHRCRPAPRAFGGRGISSSPLARGRLFIPSEAEGPRRALRFSVSPLQSRRFPLHFFPFCNIMLVLSSWREIGALSVPVFDSFPPPTPAFSISSNRSLVRDPAIPRNPLSFQPVYTLFAQTVRTKSPRTPFLSSPCALLPKQWWGVPSGSSKSPDSAIPRFAFSSI